MTKKLNSKFFIPEEKVREKKSNCKGCPEKIFSGDNYISVVYSDGYMRKVIGSFHPECWEKYNNELKQQK